MEREQLEKRIEELEAKVETQEKCLAEIRSALLKNFKELRADRGYLQPSMQELM
jgi:uncharacterized coiled-coil protein SlyX